MNRVRYPEYLVNKRTYGQGKDPKYHDFLSSEKPKWCVFLYKNMFSVQLMKVQIGFVSKNLWFYMRV